MGRIIKSHDESHWALQSLLPWYVNGTLNAAEREQSGLSRRVEDVLARAAVTFGNGDDEYLEREALDNHHQDLFAREIQNGQRRLKDLGSSIGHFKFLRASLLSRFPGLRATSDH